MDRPYLSATDYEESPLYAFVRLTPPLGARAPRSTAHFAVVLDASGSMHNFQLTEEQCRHWLEVGQARGDIVTGYADGQASRFWKGQTLEEMSRVARKPLTLATDAVGRLLRALEQDDLLSLIAFSTNAQLLFPRALSLGEPGDVWASLEQLEAGKLVPTLGTGTRMAEAVRIARNQIFQSSVGGRLNRMIVISDGMVEDKDTSLQQFDQAKDEEVRVTTIGVGEEFDEEFLMKVANRSGGEYYYLQQADELAAALTEEFKVVKSTVVRNIELAVAGVNEAVIADVYQAQPAFRYIDEMWTEGGWTRVKVGELSSERPITLLVEIAPPLLAEGERPVATVQVSSAEGSGAAAEISMNYTRDPLLLQMRNPNETDLVERFLVFRSEREAHRARERGDVQTATEQLRNATRILRKLGERELAQEFEMQAKALESNEGLDAGRSKRIKATTRRLARR